MVIGNDAEFDVMAGGSGGREFASQLALRASAVIYKMGEKGALAFMGSTRFETPVYPVDAVKPTGAGDAFMAGLVTGLASGLGLAAAVRRGAAAAAIVVTRVGCAPASPTAAELDGFMRHRPIPA
jgi:5-dehydro-2-deoxygluconokinase